MFKDDIDPGVELKREKLFSVLDLSLLVIFVQTVFTFSNNEFLCVVFKPQI